MSSISLDSFLDRLGLENGDMRLCVWLAFVAKRDAATATLPGEQATACLEWVAAVQVGKMELNTFRALLDSLLIDLGNPLTPEELKSVARCMLSGHTEPDAESDK